MSVESLAAATALDALPGLVIPAGLFTFLGLIGVALIKQYYNWKNSVPKQQSDHIKRLTDERNEAVKDRDTLYDQLERTRDLKNIVTGRAQAAELLAQRYSTQIADLTEKITELNLQITQLRQEVARLQSP